MYTDTPLVKETSQTEERSKCWAELLESYVGGVDA